MSSTEELDRFSFLADMSRSLSASLDYETTLATVARMTLPVRDSWAVVDVLEDDGSIRRLPTHHPSSEAQAALRELHRAISDWTLTRRSVPRASSAAARREIIPDVTDEILQSFARDPEHLARLRAANAGAYVSVPLLARGAVLGAISFLFARGGRRAERRRRRARRGSRGPRCDGHRQREVAARVRIGASRHRDSDGGGGGGGTPQVGVSRDDEPRIPDAAQCDPRLLADPRHGRARPHDAGAARASRATAGERAPPAPARRRRARRRQGRRRSARGAPGIARHRSDASRPRWRSCTRRRRRRGFA